MRNLYAGWQSYGYPLFPKVFFLMLLVLCNAFLSVQISTTRENQVKATFLFNFTRFVDWPATAFSSNSDFLIIGIAGKDPFGTYLDDMVAGEKVNGHPLVVVRCKTLEEMKKCQVLFLPPEENTYLVKGRSGYQETLRLRCEQLYRKARGF